MNQGLIAAVLLVIGCALQILAWVLGASAATEDQATNAGILAFGACLLWMLGCFGLTFHYRISATWGVAGIFGILGLYFIWSAGKRHRRRAGHHFYDPLKPDELPGSREQGRRPRTYDY